MYKISVPVINENAEKYDKEQIMKDLKRLDAKRVFLVLSVHRQDAHERKKSMQTLDENCRFFKSHGFEVGAWLWTFWVENNTKFRNMRSLGGKEVEAFMCSTDENFVEFASSLASDIAKCNVDMIMYDDDFRFGYFYGDVCCLCDEHIRRINEKTNSQLSREDIQKHIISGGKNIYRDAFLETNRESLMNFSSSVRKAVDKVNPKIRMGFCTCMTSWDIDGTNPLEIASILAGDTKPFIRLIGAPYWAVNKAWGNALQDVVELERMESSWTKSKNLEIMAEGDAFPRPRTMCPASYLEGFDTAIRASGCTDGILKYAIDYHSNLGYEDGYIKFHERNKNAYKKIDEMFGTKESSGVRVYESMKKLSDMVVPTKVNCETDIQEDLFFSKAARTLSYNTIPTVYEGSGVCGICFDENARKLPLEALEKGLIIDIAAAEILAERGVDTGVEKIGKETRGTCEHFLSSDNKTHADQAKVYDISIKDGAEVLSYIDTPLGKIPMSYRYENQDGKRFLVLNINTRKNSNQVLFCYERSRQYANNILWLSGEKLPAWCHKNPALYIQCKKDEHAMAVGLWNYFADIVTEPVIELDKKYSDIRFLDCTGELKGDKVYLSDIPAFGFAAFEVRS